MAKKFFKPKVRQLSETYIGRRLSEPAERMRHAHIVQELRDAAKAELESLERSERLTKDDFSVVINARADQLDFKAD